MGLPKYSAEIISRDLLPQLGGPVHPVRVMSLLFFFLVNEDFPAYEEFAEGVPKVFRQIFRFMLDNPLVFAAGGKEDTFLAWVAATASRMQTFFALLGAACRPKRTEPQTSFFGPVSLVNGAYYIATQRAAQRLEGFPSMHALQILMGRTTPNPRQTRFYTLRGSFSQSGDSPNAPVFCIPVLFARDAGGAVRYIGDAEAGPLIAQARRVATERKKEKKAASSATETDIIGSSTNTPFHVSKKAKPSPAVVDLTRDEEVCAATLGKMKAPAAAPAAAGADASDDEASNGDPCDASDPDAMMTRILRLQMEYQERHGATRPVDWSEVHKTNWQMVGGPQDTSVEDVYTSQIADLDRARKEKKHAIKAVHYTDPAKRQLLSIEIDVINTSIQALRSKIESLRSGAGPSAPGPPGPPGSPGSDTSSAC